ncbi:mu-type opioid receptor-like [Mizuhopecten yessoensis]|uniref:Galanin receptor type 2 n=1 Tax=Mizuhopecten yessoensis TaxID=6573 RepID=A0A210Q5H4_MIZYE|nr:mu-type opioid receptor-like [Mizuhopecten yessoensis]OWF43978.1 Galanin receptor type 2 [Mizuhopecten yessoensis]
MTSMENSTIALTTGTLPLEADISSANMMPFGINITTVIPEVSDSYSACSSADSCLWAIISPFIFFIGVFGNILNLYVLIRLKFYKNATLSLLFVLAFVDITVLCVGPTRYWIRATFDVDIRDVSGFSCKFHLFLIYFSMHMSSWILVQVTCVRFVKTVLLDNRFIAVQKLVTINNSLIILGILGVVLAALDFHYFFTNGIKDGGCDSLTKEILAFEEFIFTYIDLVVLVILPGIIMTVLNLLIIRQIKKLKCNKRLSTGSDGSNRMSRKGQQPASKMTRMLVFTSFYFVAASLPICIYFIVDSYVRPCASPDVEQSLDLANAIVYLLQFTHFAINFYFYTATNQRFRTELGKIGKGVERIFHSVPSSDPSTSTDYHLRSGTGDT